MADPTNKPEDKLGQQGIHLSDESVDVSTASWDESLSRVWVEESSGELCASVDRLLFESPVAIAVRFMEPHGFNLNFENLLACLDSMRFGVFTKTSGGKREDGRVVAKKIAPSLYMKLPQRSAKGPLLARFYDEIAKYESELTRLQQYEAQSRRAMHEALKDESGRSAVAQLQRDNEVLREEVDRLSRRVGQLTAAIESVPLHSRENSLPHGMKVSQVRQVKEQDNLVHLKSDAGQYSFPLSQLNGLPVVGARALSLHEGGQIRGVWIFDPAPLPFALVVAEVLISDGTRIKARTDDRVEHLLEVGASLIVPERGSKILLKRAGGYVIGWTAQPEGDASAIIAELYDEQTKRQIDDTRVEIKSGRSRSRRKGRAA